MKQLIQNLKNGELSLMEMPVPACKPGGVVVRNVRSLVSIGTEKSIIDLAKKGLIGKAKSRPDLFKRALDKARREGFLQVYKESMQRLDEPFPLGYSAAGIVVEAGDAVEGITVGQHVAICGGGLANHAEYNFVPCNMCVPLPTRPDGDVLGFDEAAFGMVGAIALHGVREAGVTPGETVLVIGLGLLGLITIQILDAMGCFPIGADIDPHKMEIARRYNTLGILDASAPGFTESVMRATGGAGADATIITAAADSNAPIEAAQACTRTRGRIELVGVTQIHLDRKSFFEKELEFSVSRGDGPGMFDESYILGGRDYPREYVRWTKNRNVEYFLKLVAAGKVDVASLITHHYSFENAVAAYGDIDAGAVQSIGVLFDYPEASQPEAATRRVVQYAEPSAAKPGKTVGFIGGGMFTKNILLPAMQELDVRLKSVATTQGISAGHIASKFGFENSTTDYTVLLQDAEIDSVCITTRHDSHAKFALEALAAGKHVYVEKPLCLTLDELAWLIEAKNARPERKLFVGYNRRYSSFVDELQQFFRQDAGSPKVMVYRCNAGFIPDDHWSQDLTKGGGRILGEVCHFVDLCAHIAGAPPVEAHGAGILPDGRYRADDNLVSNLRFAEGSVASIIYTAMGDRGFSRERIEVYCGGGIGLIEDFKKVELLRGGKRKKRKAMSRDMGYRQSLGAFFEQGEDFRNLVDVTLGTFAIERSLRKGGPVAVDELREELDALLNSKKETT